MNGTIRVRLLQNGRKLGVNSLNNRGVILQREIDAWPRGLTIEFDANNVITKYRMDRVRQLRGWEPRQFKLNVSVDSGDLVVSGIDHDTLPEGGYWLKVTIADLILPRSRSRVDVRDDKEAIVELDARTDPRNVELTAEVASFDSEIARVLTANGSVIDAQPAAEWLLNPNPRPRRKACLLNMLAKLRTAPTASNPLINDVRRTFFCDVSRIYVSVEERFYTRLEELARDPNKPFYAEGRPTSSSHRDLLTLIKDRGLESSIDEYELKSFRQEGRPSMQAVVGIPPADFVDGRYYADIDIDLGNPLQDLQGLIIHFGEVVSPGHTDHLAMRKQLGENQRIAPYLYYKVVRNED